MEKVVKIINTKQAEKYIKNGVQPVRIYADEDTDTLVFEFYVSDTHELYQRWLAHTLN